MKLVWDEEAEARYQKITQESLQERIVTLSVLGASLFPFFIFLDFITQKDHLLPLALYRFGATFIFICSYLVSKTDFIKRHTLPMIYFIFTVATVSISLMCVEIGGFNSPYYAGINLILLAAALILPVNEKIMIGLVSTIIGIYVVFNSLWSANGYDITAAFVNNMYFLLTTGFICVTAAFLTERLRRLSYLRYLELDRAYTYLKGENKNSQDSIQTMVKEISTRRVELEKALQEAELARSEAQSALQLREDFISLASHELNTPLTSLKLQTQVAQMRLDSTPPTEHSEHYRKIVNTYDNQLKRLIRMVDDMLDISRIKKGKLDLFFAEVDLGAAIKDIVDRTPKKQLSIAIASAGKIDGKL
jgi:signal transduction histidine kinase